MALVNVLITLGAPFVLLYRTAAAVRRTGLALKECAVQFVELGTRSSWLVGGGLAFLGAVMVNIAWAQARKYTGNIVVVGPAYFELMIREFCPLTAAILCASRAGAGTSAELAAMSVNEQVEALELSAADPHAELVAPRLVASALAVPLLTVVGIVTASLSAYATVRFVYAADGLAFIDPRFVDLGDVSCCFLKSILCGLFIPLAASRRGLMAKGGAHAVGGAVTDGVVDAAMGCLLIDFTVTAAFFLVGI
ncbi:MAG: ABC transporter permease [Myxococcaceae bacterium]|nr:ABC transporter permease [Myxococcaceae bacterium]